MSTDKRIRIKKVDTFLEAVQFTLNGSIPHPSSKHEIEFKLVLLQVLANLNPQGFKLYGSVDVCKATTEQTCGSSGELDPGGRDYRPSNHERVDATMSKTKPFYRFCATAV